MKAHKKELGNNSVGRRGDVLHDVCLPIVCDSCNLIFVSMLCLQMSPQNRVRCLQAISVVEGQRFSFLCQCPMKRSISYNGSQKFVQVPTCRVCKHDVVQPQALLSDSRRSGGYLEQCTERQHQQPLKVNWQRLPVRGEVWYEQPEEAPPPDAEGSQEPERRVLEQQEPQLPGFELSCQCDNLWSWAGLWFLVWTRDVHVKHLSGTNINRSCLLSYWSYWQPISYCFASDSEEVRWTSCYCATITGSGHKGWYRLDWNSDESVRNFGLWCCALEVRSEKLWCTALIPAVACERVIT